MPAKKTPANTGKPSLPASVQKKLDETIALSGSLPGVCIIHDLEGNVVFMSESGLKLLGITLEELIEMGPAYHDRFFNSDDAKDYVPQIFGLFERNDNDEFISYFQQVRYNEHSDYKWYLSSTKVLTRDKERKPMHIITLSAPIDPKHHLSDKVQRLLDENLFLRKNYDTFAHLGAREKEVLRLLALGKTNAEIAAELFISVATVETHRKNIKRKLNASSGYELAEYARAFNLI